jgi:hypothetical protein
VGAAVVPGAAVAGAAVGVAVLLPHALMTKTTAAVSRGSLIKGLDIPLALPMLNYRLLGGGHSSMASIGHRLVLGETNLPSFTAMTQGARWSGSMTSHGGEHGNTRGCRGLRSGRHVGTSRSTDPSSFFPEQERRLDTAEIRPVAGTPCSCPARCSSHAGIDATAGLCRYVTVTGNANRLASPQDVSQEGQPADRGFPDAFGSAGCPTRSGPTADP